jgi:calcium-dependent protein kinase
MLTITGTLYYRAPEMFSGGGYNEKVDVWASGVLLYKLVAGSTPFESEYHSKTIANIMGGEIKFTEAFDQYSAGLKGLILRMLRKDPGERLSAVECLRDTWFYPVTNLQPYHKGSYVEG